MRSVEKLKEIYIKEAEYMVKHYFDELNNVGTSLMNNNPDEEGFENIKDKAQQRLVEEYNITEEELLVIQQHHNEWQKDIMPIVMKRLSN